MNHPEHWLREEPLDGDPLRRLLLCTFRQAKDESARAVQEVGASKLWARPFGLAPLGFHLRHLAESSDRLLTYAEGGALSEEQMTILAMESTEELAWNQLQPLLDSRLNESRLRLLPLEDLSAPRFVGRARIQVPLGTLLGHIAEHIQRHLGQIATLRRLLPQL